MKNVVSNHQLAHLWAHLAQPAARNANGSFYFSGNTIYSNGSHFPIARHVQSERGNKKAVLFTSRDYSITTQKHKSLTSRAIPSDVPVFVVARVMADSGRDHAENVAELRERIAHAVSKCAHARQTWSKESWHGCATKTLQQLRDYSEFFSLGLVEFPTVPALDAEEMRKIRERERKAEQEAKEQREIDAKLAEIRKAEQNREAIAKFRNGTSIHITGALYGMPVMLRIRTFDADPSAIWAVGRVETSLGAQVPLPDALVAVQWVRNVVARGVEFVPEPEGRQFKIGHYTLNRIEANGTVHIGCHVIPYAEIERIAPELEALAKSAA